MHLIIAHIIISEYTRTLQQSDLIWYTIVVTTHKYTINGIKINDNVYDF